MPTNLMWRPVCVFGLALHFGMTLPWGGSGALASDADDSCRLSEQTCASEGLVIITPGADRLVHWGSAGIDFRPIALRWFGPSILDRLGPDHSITLLLGREELRSGRLDALIEEIHALGGAVIVTHPSLADAGRLNELVGARGAAWDAVAGEPRLYGLREAVGDDRSHPMAFVLFPDPSELRRTLTERETEWLLERIGRSPPALERNPALDASATRARWSISAPSVMVGFLLDELRGLLVRPAIAQAASQCQTDPEGCLTQIAQSIHSSLIKTVLENTVELDNFIWSARSFDNEQDFYYVDQEIQYSTCPTSQSQVFVAIENTPTIGVASTIQPSPGTTEETTTVTSGVNFGIGGNTGYANGFTFNVAPSLSISQTKETTVPPVEIENQTDPASGVTAWEFTIGEVLVPGGDDVSFDTAWIWAVDLSAYGSDQDQFVFSSEVGGVSFFFLEPGNCQSNEGPGLAALDATLTSSLDQPFPTETIEAPVVASVTPGTVSPGNTFQLAGTGFYPSLVEAVLLGGQALDSGNWFVNSDTQITVTAPPDPPAFNTSLPVEVKTADDVSNTDQTVIITD